MFSSRLNIREQLEKMLNEGITIVMDRYAYSGVAYSAAKVKAITDTRKQKILYYVIGIVLGLV